jgi:rubrerythrin
MESLHGDAIEAAITIENRSVVFYREVLSRVTDNNTRRVFELLKKEEEGHLKSVCDLFQGTKDELEIILNENSVHSDPYYSVLLAAVKSNATEKDALETALKEEQACIRRYSQYVDSIRLPHIREVFARILDETHKHAEMISEEYMRLMGMVDRTDQDIFVRE